MILDIDAGVENAWDSLFRFVMDLLKYGMRLERDSQEKECDNNNTNNNNNNNNNDNGIETAIQNINPVSTSPGEKDFSDSDGVSICEKSRNLSRLSSETNSKHSIVVTPFSSNGTEDSETNDDDEKSSTSTIRTLHITEASPEG